MTDMRSLVLGLAMLASGCGLSPAQPSEIETRPVFTVSPGSARRFSNTVNYTGSFNFALPSGDTIVTVQSLEFTFLGPNGEAYGTRSYGSFALSAGSSIGGGVAFVDTNT